MTRRTAGSRTMLDVVRSAIGRGRRPDDDLRILESGGEVVMTCWAVPERGRPTRHEVVLGTAEPAVAKVAALLGDPPYGVLSVAASRSPWTGSPFMSDVNGTSARGRWTLAVPSTDVGTFREALARLNLRASAGHPGNGGVAEQHISSERKLAPSDPMADA